ncbi:hypothetical protein C8A00DRAFT_46757 [Chaetomidium leptoderma]|uniref:Myb-like domain-containing protein n=1 Tax=Chaetomidium leptoderma TaxID=669021 RepID=A0AAN6VFN9_9PEZI|nr:hypothetical protein C8A00DRAFT_46757 [Chaetomidium leptoderma]
MTRTRGPPRRPSRDIRAGQDTEGSSGGPQPLSSESQGGGYRRIAAQPTNTTPGSGPPRYPPLPNATMLPPASNPSASTAPISAQAEEVPIDDDETTAGAPAADLAGDERAAQAEYPYSIYNHGTWTADDDKALIQARTQGQNWADLQRTHFPAKTANACRKRYERLVERRGIYDYSGRRLELVANEYMNVRKEIWSGLADRLGMKWEVVEALCMGSGLRSIQSNARSYTNRARRDNRISQKTREAQADAATAGSAVLAPGMLPVGTEFGTAFRARGPDQPGHLDRIGVGGDRNDTNLMPPPPFIPMSAPSPSTRLPPMALAPQAPFRGYLNGSNPRSSGGPSHAISGPPPSSGAIDWQGANIRGAV